MKNSFEKITFLSFIFLFINLVVSPQTAWGQKIKSTLITYEYIQLPSVRISEDIKTYNVRINQLPTSFGNMLGGDYIANSYLKMSGFERVDDKGDIQINVNFITGLQPIQAEIESKKVTKKQKDKPDIVYTKYWYKLQYMTPTYQVNIVDNTTGKTLLSKSCGGNTLSDTWGEDDVVYKSSNKLRTAWRDNEVNFYGVKESKLLNPSEARKYISNATLTKARSTVSFRYVKKHKKHDYKDLNDCVTKMKKALAALQQDQIGYTNKLLRIGFQDFELEANDAIGLWKEAIATASSNKKDRINEKIVEHLHYNLAKTYMLLYDFENAEHYMNLVNNAGTRGKKYLESSMKSSKKLVTLNAWRGDDLTSTPSPEEIEQHLTPYSKNETEDYIEETATNSEDLFEGDK